jgi:hypothetical protein
MKPRHTLPYVLVAIMVVTGGAALAQLPGPYFGFGSSVLESNFIFDRWSKSVEMELKVSEEVAQKLNLVRADYRATYQKAYQDAGINPPDNPFKLTENPKAMEIGPKVLREFAPKAAALLSPDQHTRLEQIYFQDRLRLTGPKALLAKNVAQALKLTNDQRRTLLELARGFQQGASKGAAWRAEEFDKAIAALTDEQKETLNKLKGEKFSQFDRP